MRHSWLNIMVVHLLVGGAGYALVHYADPAITAKLFSLWNQATEAVRLKLVISMIVGFPKLWQYGDRIAAGIVLSSALLLWLGFCWFLYRSGASHRPATARSSGRVVSKPRASRRAQAYVDTETGRWVIPGYKAFKG